MASNHLLEIAARGQSIWIDYLTRDMIQSGELERLIKERGIRGMTSNPSIFEKAIVGNALYDDDIAAGIQAGRSLQDIYESLIFSDIRHACAIFRPIYDESGGLDGYVSIEVPPTIAHDTEATVREAKRYYQEIGCENVMIKIPGTTNGLKAVEQVIEAGINVNITLLFAVDRYVDTAWAYIRGLEARMQQGQSIDKIASVASFFLSRIDTKIDQRLDERLKTIGSDDMNIEARLKAFQGKVAIANAKVAYQKYKEICQSDRWQALAAKGANEQRLLWASTSTKNPDYSDVMYVDELIGPDTVNTLPMETIEACADHCDVDNRIEMKVDEAQHLLQSLSEPDVAIDLNQVMEEVLNEGIDKFVQPFQSLMSALEEKVKQLTPTASAR